MVTCKFQGGLPKKAAPIARKGPNIKYTPKKRPTALVAQGTPTLDERDKGKKTLSMPILSSPLNSPAPVPTLKQLELSPDILCSTQSPASELMYDIFGTESSEDDSSSSSESANSDDLSRLIESSLFDSPPQCVSPIISPDIVSTGNSRNQQFSPQSLAAAFTPRLLTTSIKPDENGQLQVSPSVQTIIDNNSTPPVFKCYKCQVNFSKLSNLRRHNRHVHAPGSFKYMCNTCVFESERKDNVIRHSRQAHGLDIEDHLAPDVRPFDPKLTAEAPVQTRPAEVLTEFQYKDSVRFRVVKGQNQPIHSAPKASTIPRHAKPSDTRDNVVGRNAPVHRASSTTTLAMMQSGIGTQTHAILYNEVRMNESKPTSFSMDMHSQSESHIVSSCKDTAPISANDPAIQTEDSPAELDITDSHESIKQNPIIGFDANGHIVTMHAAPHTSSRDPRLNRGETVSPRLLQVVKVPTKDDPEPDVSHTDCILSQENAPIVVVNASTNTEPTQVIEVGVQTEAENDDRARALQELDFHACAIQHILQRLTKNTD